MASCDPDVNMFASIKKRAVHSHPSVSLILLQLLNSENVPTMRSISISQILFLPDIADVKMLSVSQVLLCNC